MPLGGLHKVCPHTILQRLGERLPHVGEQCRAVGARGEGGFPISETRGGHAIDREVGLERFALGRERVERSTMVRERGCEYSGGRVVRAVGAGQPESQEHEAVGPIRREVDPFWRQGLEGEGGALR